MPTFRSAFFAPLALALFGCSSPTSYQTVPFAGDPGQPVPPDQCRVYIARSGQMTGAVRTVELRSDGVLLAVLGENGYVSMDRPARRGVVQLIYNGPAVDQRLDGRAIEDVLQFEGERGETYYFRLHLDPSTKIPAVDRLGDADGQALIASRSPAEIR